MVDGGFLLGILKDMFEYRWHLLQLGLSGWLPSCCSFGPVTLSCDFSLARTSLSRLSPTHLLPGFNITYLSPQLSKRVGVLNTLFSILILQDSESPQLTTILLYLSKQRFVAVMHWFASTDFSTATANLWKDQTVVRIVIFQLLPTLIFLLWRTSEKASMLLGVALLEMSVRLIVAVVLMTNAAIKLHVVEHPSRCKWGWGWDKWLFSAVRARLLMGKPIIDAPATENSFASTVSTALYAFPDYVIANRALKEFVVFANHSIACKSYGSNFWFERALCICHWY